jgi:hypothetical protein
VTSISRSFRVININVSGIQRFYAPSAYSRSKIVLLAQALCGRARFGALRRMHCAARMGETLIPGANVNLIAEIALARGDLRVARRCGDETVALAKGVNLAVALVARARVAIAEGEPGQAERDAHEALTVAVTVDTHPMAPETLECLAGVACDAESHREAARLFGAADTLRRSMGGVRFTVYDDAYNASIGAARNALTDSEFDSVWAEGPNFQLPRPSPTRNVAGANVSARAAAGHR